jgi:hypothetical protein
MFLARGARADKGTSEGAFKDSAGKEHPWKVERSHLLTWEGQPYAPAGVVFRSAYLKSPSQATLQQDAQELDRLRAAGVGDLWIEPGRGLLENGVAQTQAVLDAVESRGFRYGLRIGDRSRNPLIGFSPSLPVIRVPVSRLQPGATERWEVPVTGARRVVYALVQARSSREGVQDYQVQDWAIASGEVVVEQNLAQIEVQLKNSKLLGKSRGLLLVIPEVQVEPEDLGSFGDLWSGMEDYAARLKKYAKALKFGPGLRFILDPFSAGDGTVGQEDNVFPSSTAFHQAFQDWLEHRTGIRTVNLSWRTSDRQIPGMEEAARLIPTWPRNDPPEGDGWLFDPVEKAAYRCTPRLSTIWQDLDNFRADTLKRWMNVTAATLKQDSVNVPMLFSWATYHPLFINSPSPSGYDGLGAQLYGAAPEIARESAAYALAEAEESDRNTWLVAARLAGPRDQNDNPTPLADSAQARAAWAAIREVGFRGVYVDPQQAANAAAIAKDLETAIAGDSAALQKKVPLVFYPMPLAPGDRLAKLSNGVWWLPSAATARMLRYGESVIGYEMVHPLGSEHAVQKGTVLWSPTGKQDVTFYLDKFSQKVALFDSAGAPIKLDVKKNELHLALSDEPVIVVGLDPAAVFPLELAVTQLKQFDELLAQADARRFDTSSMRNIYENARKSLDVANASVVYNSITPYVVSLRQALATYIWVEGERPAYHNFSGTSYQAGASAGAFLKLDRRDPAASGAYQARYPIDARQDAAYEIWVAGRVPGRPGISPLVWTVDDSPAVQVDAATPVGQDYAPGLAWFLLGKVTLQIGRHDLTLVVPQRSGGADGRFTGGIDAVVLSREPFQPKGAEKPAMKAPPRPPTAPTEEKGKRGDKGKAAEDKDKPGGEKEKRGEEKGRRGKGKGDSK